MNKCFISGIVEDEVRFEFLYNSGFISIALTKLRLLDKNNTVVNIFGYDEKADYMCRRINKGDIIQVYGCLFVKKDLNFEVRVLDVEKYGFRRGGHREKIINKIKMI